MKRDNKYPRYKYDVYVRFGVSIIAAYFAAKFGGGNEGFLELIYAKGFLIEYAVTLVITLLVVHLIYLVTSWLDRHFDWHEKPLLRVPLQLLLGIIIPDLIIFILAAYYFSYYDRNIFEYNYDNTNLQFNTALITIYNLYYYIRCLLTERAMLKELTTPANERLTLHPFRGPVNTDEIKVTAAVQTQPNDSDTYGQTIDRAIFIARTHTSSSPVPLSEIAYFHLVNKLVFLRKFSGQELSLALSLDTIESQLDRDKFFRVSRQMIVNYDAVVEFYDGGNGKLRLNLKPRLEGEVTVSKLAAQKFRTWMKHLRI